MAKNEFRLIVPDDAQTAEAKLGSDVTLPCHLSPELSAADMEIRWFKGTDCVCLYMEGQMIAGVGYKGRVGLNKEMERGNISLELKGVRESDDGDYLCQVTSGDRTEKVARLSLKTHEVTEMLQTENTPPEQNDKKKMENSVLMAVFTELKDTKQECKKKDAEIEQLKAERLHTAGEPEKGKAQQENMHKPAKELETSELDQDNPETKTLEKLQNIEEVKVFTYFSGNSNAFHHVHKTFIGSLRNQILNLREVDTMDESDITLIFCPVSQIETDIDAALKILEGETGSKLAVLVVLHHTTDPEKIVPDSSSCVKRTDILTVDCLFNEDTGLLKCQKNSDAVDKVMNWLKQQGRKAGAEVCPLQNSVQEWDQERSLNSKKDEGESESVQRETSEPIFTELKDTSKCLKKAKQESEEKDAQIEQLKDERLQTAGESEKENTQQENMHKPAKELELHLNIEEVKVFTLFTGNANALQKTHKKFIGTLKKQIPNLREVDTLHESDVALMFCPNVSRVGTDIDAALKRLEDNTDSKLTVLVVLHPTFDPEKVVPDSSRCVNKTDILTVDCLFNEDTGLLNCQKNSDSTDKVVNLLLQQGRKAGAKVCPNQNTEQVQGQGKSHKSVKDKSESKSAQTERVKMKDNKPKTKGVNMFSILAGNVNNCDQKFIDILENRMRNLRNVRTVDESDIILVFCPIVSRAGNDIEAALKKLKCCTDSEQTLYLKPTVVVVLHHTFEPEKVIPDSSSCVKRTDILTVDCLFYEDTGLLKCQKNSDAVDKVVNWLKQQEKKQETSGDNMQQMTSTSSCPVNYFVSVTGDAEEHHKHFINALQKQMNLRKVSTVQESDVILLFSPDISEYGKRIEKPVVLISLHHTVDPESVLKISGLKYRQTIFPVECIFLQGKGLLNCPINREEISAVLSFLKKK